jgi:hypothetical protein
MNVHLSYDLDDDTWTEVVDGDGPWVDIDIGFTAGGTVPVHFDDLKFGWTLTVNGEPLEPAVFPPDGTVYRMTDQPYLVTERTICEPDDSCLLQVWVTETGIETSHTVEFTVPQGVEIGDND